MLIKFKKITILLVIFFVFYLQLIPKVKAEPVSFAPGFDAIKYLGSLILLSQGLKVTSENALNAFASDFVNKLSEVDRDQIYKSAINTGFIGVSPSVAYLSKNYVAQINSKVGNVINYRAANMSIVTSIMSNLNWNDVFLHVHLSNLSNLPDLGTNGSLSTIFFKDSNSSTQIIASVKKSLDTGNKVVFFVKYNGVEYYNKQLNGDTFDYSIDVKPGEIVVFTPSGTINLPNLTVTTMFENPYVDITYVRGSASYVVNSNDFSIDDLYPNDLTNRQIGVPVPADGTAINSLNDLVGKNYRDLTISEPMAGDVPVTDIDLLNNIWGSLARFFDLSIPVNWQPMQAVGAVVTNKFPFSLPWDISRGIQGINASPERPKIEGDWTIPGIGPIHMRIEIPTWMDPLFVMMRGAEVVLFVVGLIYAHSRLMGGQK